VSARAAGLERASGGPRGGYPAWRRAMPNKDQVYEIAGTSGMPGNIPGPVGGTPIVGGIGKAFADLASWGGFAADRLRSTWWGVAQGGDAIQWSNKVYSVDLRADLPQFTIDFLGTDETTAKASPYNSAYYSDGLPKARQTYYDVKFDHARRRCIMVLCSAAFGVDATFDVTDGYDTVAHAYDPAGTWAASGIMSDGGNTLVHVTTQDPRNDDIYITGVGGVFKKWTQATAAWSTPLRGGPSWGFRGGCIDPTRNKWMYFDGNVNTLDLTSWASAVGATSGAAIPAYLDYAAPLYDEDNDRYLVFCGDTAGSHAGTVHAIDPVTRVATKIADVPMPDNGWLSKVAYFPKLGGVAALPGYSSNILFLPTR